MFKDVMNHAGQFTAFAEIGLVIFFTVFLWVGLQTVRKPKQEVQRWSRLPLDEG